MRFGPGGHRVPERCTGVDNIAAMPHEFGDFQYVWTFAGVMTNNMARGRLGFGNWIPAMLYARKGLDEKLC